MIYFFLIFFIVFNFDVYAKQSLSLAVASNFVEPLKLIKTKFEKKNNIKLTIVKGSTSQLYSQIINNAPIEIFLSADQFTPKKLPKKFVTKKAQFTYAIGRLVLWTNYNKKKYKNARTFLRGIKINKLVIANPKVSPYGKASKDFLKNINVWDDINTKLVYANNINQVVSFLYSGNIKTGLISYSDKSKLRELKKGVFLEVSETFYPEIKQDVILLAKGKENHFSKIFLKFLRTSEIKQVIRSFGYKVN